MFENKCPECHQGSVFDYFLFINKRCKNCGFLYEKEEGYFFMPMIIAYVAFSIVAVPILVYITFGQHIDFTNVAYVACGCALVFMPIFYRYSKLFWLHVETAFDKKQQLERDRADKIVADQQKATKDSSREGS